MLEYGSFRKLGDTLFWGPNNKDHYYLGYDIRVPYFRKLPNISNKETPKTFLVVLEALNVALRVQVPNNHILS